MRVAKLILLIIGTIIGAGFVSGKEIAVFFANFGYHSLIFVVPMFFLLYFSIYKLLTIGANSKINNTYELNVAIFKKDNKIIKIFTFVAFVILSSTMFSAIPSSFGYGELGLNKIIITLVIGLVMIFVISKNTSFIQTICLFIVPIILLVVLSVCILNFDIQSNSVLNHNIVLVPYNMLNYVCRNIFLSYFVISNSSYKLSQKQCKLVSLLASLILCSLMFIVIIVEISNPHILTLSMPLLELSQCSDVLGVFYLVVLLFAIVTTLISALVTLKSFFNFKHKFLNVLAPTIICALLSMISFDYFVEYLYPVIGMLGAYLLLVLFFPNFFLQNSNKEIHDTSEQTKN